MAALRPFGKWLKKVTKLKASTVASARNAPPTSRDELRRWQVAMGWTMEDLEMILHPMAEGGKEAIGSMGDDAPIAVLSDKYRGLHHFFRQNFSQVTNPPIDSLRERRVMSLTTRLGNLGNILDEDESQLEFLQLESPILLTEEYDALRQHLGDAAAVIDCTFDVDGGPHALGDAVKRIQSEAEDAVRGGHTHLVLTDEHVTADRAAIPMILATGAVHTHLVGTQLRTFTSVNVRSAECLDVHYCAVLVGVGATTVNAWLAQEAIADRHRRGLFGRQGLDRVVGQYKRALEEGLLKIISKMGIAIISSYRGGYNFEAVGLSRALVAEYFPGMPSRISGIGLTGIQKKVSEIHRRAHAEDVLALPVGGFYRYRRSGEAHYWDGMVIHQLQNAVEHQLLQCLPALSRPGKSAAAGQPARPSGLPQEARSDQRRPGQVDHPDPQVARGARHFAGRALAGSARDAVDCDEPHRGKVELRRGR